MSSFNHLSRNIPSCRVRTNILNKNRTSSLLHKKTNLSNVLLLNTPMKTNQNQCGRREGNNMLKNVFGPWHQTKMIWSFSVLTLLLFLNSNSPNIAGALVLRFPLSRALYSSLSADNNTVLFVGILPSVHWEAKMTSDVYAPYIIIINWR